MKKKLIILLIITGIFLSLSAVCQSSPLVYSVKVPNEYGHVSQRYCANGKNEKFKNLEIEDKNKTVLLIQDAHMSFDAQINIARIINLLVSEIGVPFVGIEGAVGEYGFEVLREFPIQAVKEIAGMEYVKVGKLVGSELAAILTNKSFVLFGVENKDLLRENYQSFYASVTHQARLKDFVQELIQTVAVLKSQVYSEELKRFDDEFFAYQKDPNNMLCLLQTIFRLCVTLKIDLTAYTYLMQINEHALFGKNILEGFDVRSVNNELADIGVEIRKRLAKNEDELNIIDLSERAMILKRLITLSAFQTDVDNFRKNKKKFAIASIQGTLSSFQNKCGITTALCDVARGDEFDLSCVEKFYSVVDMRNTVILDNLIQHMDARGQKVGVLVAGGYHADALTAMMRERNVSYITITPNVAHVTDDCGYMHRLMGSHAFPSKNSPGYFSHARFNLTYNGLKDLGIITNKDLQTVMTEIGRGFKGKLLFDEDGNLKSFTAIEEVSKALLLEEKLEYRNLGNALMHLREEIVHAANSSELMMSPVDDFAGYAKQFMEVLEKRFNVDASTLIKKWEIFGVKLEHKINLARYLRQNRERYLNMVGESSYSKRTNSFNVAEENARASVVRSSSVPLKIYPLPYSRQSADMLDDVLATIQDSTQTEMACFQYNEYKATHFNMSMKKWDAQQVILVPAAEKLLAAKIREVVDSEGITVLSPDMLQSVDKNAKIFFVGIKESDFPQETAVRDCITAWIFLEDLLDEDTENDISPVKLYYAKILKLLGMYRFDMVLFELVHSTGKVNLQRVFPRWKELLTDANRHILESLEFAHRIDLHRMAA